MLGTLAAPSLLGSCTGSESDKAAGISFAMNYFKVSEGDLRKVLAAALEKGGDYADLFFEHSYRNNVGLQDGAVNRASSNIDFGMGVRVLSGDQTGYAYVENVSLDEMLKAARTAARIATGSANTAPINLTEEKHTNNFYSVQTPWDEIAINDKMPFLQHLNRGSVNIDDEGVDGQKTYIVREGVLTSYLHDRISAKHYGIPSTGNGRRESFRQMPIPRMRATYMEAGNVTEEEIISTVKKGIYAANFTNGQVQIGAGDFTFFVKDGYLIENGKLTQPIKDINIIGNGPKALADITMVGNNYKMDNGTWTCGKDGQSCPVTCGMPSALVSKLTVGGEN